MPDSFKVTGAEVLDHLGRQVKEAYLGQPVTVGTLFGREGAAVSKVTDDTALAQNTNHFFYLIKHEGRWVCGSTIRKTGKDNGHLS